MSEFFFGLGKGHLGKRAAEIAKRHGAMLVNHIDPGCKCGRGCADNCPACKRHWFAAPNRGNPFDQRVRDAVLAALE